MGRKPWTTPDQRKFLEDNVHQYELAQASKKVNSWLSHFHDKWFQHFPIGPVEEPGDVNVIRSLTKKVSRR